MLPEVRQNTSHHIFIRLAASSSAEFSGWDGGSKLAELPRGVVWYRTARTAAPTNHQGAASSTPSALLCAHSKGYVGAGTSSVLPGLVRGGGRSSWRLWGKAHTARRPQPPTLSCLNGKLGFEVSC